MELLVFIGIIAMLIGILMPARSRARAQAFQIKCASNMRQIGPAMAMNVNDNNRWMPQLHGGVLIFSKARDTRSP